MYASTLAVLSEAKRKFELYSHDEGESDGGGGEVWGPEKIVDWGAGVASGAW